MRPRGDGIRHGCLLHQVPSPAARRGREVRRLRVGQADETYGGQRVAAEGEVAGPAVTARACPAHDSAGRRRGRRSGGAIEIGAGAHSDQAPAGRLGCPRGWSGPARSPLGDPPPTVPKVPGRIAIFECRSHLSPDLDEVSMTRSQCKIYRRSGHNSTVLAVDASLDQALTVRSC